MGAGPGHRPRACPFQPFTQTLVAQRTIQNPDRRVVSMENVAAHNRRLNQLDRRQEHPHGAATPIDQRAVRDINAHAGEDFVQAIKREMVVKL